MSGIFDYVEAVSSTKENMVRGTANDDLAEKGYNAYMTNRALSYFMDSILYANEMNMRSHLDNALQFTFYLNTLRKRKRRSAWTKPEADVNLDIVMEYFGYSRNKAREALRILTPEQITMIASRLEKGGKNNAKSKSDRGSSRDLSEDT